MVDQMMVANAYHEYNCAYDKLYESLRKSQNLLNKGFLSLKLTERDEIKYSLIDTKRKSLTNVRINEDDVDNKGEFVIDIQSTLNDVKEKETENDDNLHKRIGKNGVNDDNKINEIKESIEVIDPIKLIHGGFTSLSIKQSQKESKDVIIKIIDVINKRQNLQNLLDECNDSII